ncbi:not available [Salmonella enterica subsp. enterica serovar Typhimurium]|nr:not available [Salmonella enterica subsp. enterica serovar Typhimurium]
MVQIWTILANPLNCGFLFDHTIHDVKMFPIAIKGNIK